MFEVGSIRLFKDSVVVEYENHNTVVEGKRYNISPSQGYMGITRGYVEVVSILINEDIDNLPEESEIASSIVGHIEAMLSLTDSSDYESVKHNLYNTQWVAYKYPHNNNGEDDSTYVLPIEDFVDHTSLF